MPGNGNSDIRSNVNRRNVLKGVAVGAIGALGLAGGASGATGRHIVNATDAETVQAAKAAADSVYKTIDLGEYGTLVSGVFPQGARKELAGRRTVKYVHEDAVLTVQGPGGGPPGGGDDDPADETLPWGIDRTKADDVHAEGETGAGAHLAIIDTGIEPDHDALEANIGDGVAFETCRGGGCSEDWDDDHDHGTHVAGTAGALDNGVGVMGVSTGATLHALKVCDGSGFCSTSDVTDAIRYTADKHEDGDWYPAVANISLGSSSETPAYEDAGQYAEDKGVLLVSSAGNDGPCTDCVGYPAAYDQYMAVSATNIDDDLTSFSSTGPEVEITGPGRDVCSSVTGNSYDTFSGTSMSSPHVAGAAAQLLANGYSASDARQQLKDTAEDLGLDDNDQGAGLVDVAEALGHDGVGGTGDGTDCP